MSRKQKKDPDPTRVSAQGLNPNIVTQFRAYVEGKYGKLHTVFGLELQKAMQELMESEGWDMDSGRFINFGDDDDDDDSSHTRGGHTSRPTLRSSETMSVKIPAKRKPKSHGGAPRQVDNAQSQALTVQASLDTFTREERKKFYTYSFCRRYGDLDSVTADQLRNLTRAVFKTYDEDSIANKPNILVGDQVVFEKNKGNYEVVPSQVRKIEESYKHLETVYQKEINSDFRNGIAP
jgi:hypothetical protein